MGLFKNLPQFFPWALLVILMIHFPGSCKAIDCLECGDFDQTLGLHSMFPCMVQPVHVDGNCTVGQCSQYRVSDKEQILIIVNRCNIPETCESQLGFGKEVGCKSISGKMYKEKCEGLGIPVMMIGQGGGDGTTTTEATTVAARNGEIKEMKDDWHVEYCVCSGENCNNQFLAPSKNYGNSLKGLEVTGSGLVMMMMMTASALNL